ncbi:hypothetical protein [Streptomyces wuyuanensis]|uniref:hypothetical protein n=1 Tax=Streptomyces wuyuanensis TaxID=1196353 RepID=UPI00371FEFF1
MSGEHDAERSSGAVIATEAAAIGVPHQRGPRATEFMLSVGEAKILQFKKKHQITAVAELLNLNS